MTKRVFAIKILHYISIILLLLIILIIVIKKWHLSLWLKCLYKKLVGRHSTNQNWMFPFLLYEVSFICIQNSIFYYICQNAIQIICNNIYGKVSTIIVVGIQKILKDTFSIIPFLDLIPNIIYKIATINTKILSIPIKVLYFNKNLLILSILLI